MHACKFGLLTLLLLCMGAGTVATRPTTAPARTRPATAPAATRPTATRPAGMPPGTFPAPDLAMYIELGNVAMNLPTDWAINAGKQFKLESNPGTADKDATGQFMASLSLNQITLTGGNGKTDVAFGASQQTLAARQETNYQPLEKPAAITLGGLSGVKFGGTFKRAGTDLRNRQYFLQLNNQTYQFTFTSLSSKWDAYQSLIDRSVATLVLKK